MEKLLSELRAAFPQLSYTEGASFCWSPETAEVVYKRRNGRQALWSLLHETSHGLLGHTSYGTDFELLSLEVAAWTRAKELGEKFGIKIDEDHVQNCLDSYRDWIYARSICPKCGTKCLQAEDLAHYACFNCHTVWKVTPSRFCRAYRATKHAGNLPAVIY